MTMIGTDPTVIAVTKIDRAARALRATSVDHDDVLRRLVAIAPDHVVAAIGSLERQARFHGWRSVADHELAALG